MFEKYFCRKAEVGAPVIPGITISIFQAATMTMFQPGTGMALVNHVEFHPAEIGLRIAVEHESEIS